MKKFMAVLIALLVAASFMPAAFADEAVGVAGCSSLRVNPELSLEDQQAVCNAAEGDPTTSCAVSGSGTCSSPKLNDTLPDADHCICVGEETEEAVAEVPAG